MSRKMLIDISADSLNSDKRGQSISLNKAPFSLDDFILGDPKSKFSKDDEIARDAYITFSAAYDLVKDAVVRNGCINGEAELLNKFLKNYALNVAANFCRDMLSGFLNGDAGCAYLNELPIPVHDRSLKEQLMQFYAKLLKERPGRNIKAITNDFFGWISENTEQNLRDKSLRDMFELSKAFSIEIMGHTYPDFEELDIKAHGAKPNVTWDDIGGNEGVIETLQPIIRTINGDPSFARVGAAMPGGIFLWGPPGCGKSLIVECFVSQAKWPYLELNIQDVLDKYVGQSEKKIAELLKNPGIIVMDEFSSFGRKSENDSNAVQMNMYNILAKEMNRTRDDRIIIAMDNNPEMIHEKLKRGKRFGLMLYVGYPDMAATARILEVHLKKAQKRSQDNVPYLDHVDLNEVARAMVSKGHIAAERTGKIMGFSGADIAQVVDQVLSNIGVELQRTGRYKVPETSVYLGEVNNYDLETRYG